MYNPNSNPATIDINFDSTLDWLMKGAQPTDTCRAILSYKGIMLKKHLIEGVKKGALTEDQAEQKFNKWLDEKASKITGKNDRLINESSKQSSDRLKAETASKEAKAAKVAAKLAVVVDEAKAPEDDSVIIDSPPSEETNS